MPSTYQPKSKKVFYEDLVWVFVKVCSGNTGYSDNDSDIDITIIQRNNDSARKSAEYNLSGKQEKILHGDGDMVGW
jgi:transcription elongation factor GreA-like protein